MSGLMSAASSDGRRVDSRGWPNRQTSGMWEDWETIQIMINLSPQTTDSFDGFSGSGKSSDNYHARLKETGDKAGRLGVAGP